MTVSHRLKSNIYNEILYSYVIKNMKWGKSKKEKILNQLITYKYFFNFENIIIQLSNF